MIKGVENIGINTILFIHFLSLFGCLLSIRYSSARLVKRVFSKLILRKHLLPEAKLTRVVFYGCYY